MERFPLRWPQSWRDPQRLDLLKNSPINCLLFPGPELPAELKPVWEAARRAGFDCRLESASQQAPAGDLYVRVVSRRELNWDADQPILCAGDCFWPSVASNAGAAQAGPTGVPWVDSNGWFIQLARVRAPSKLLWLFFEPPEKRILTPRAYELAIADTETYGARWAITLDAAAAGDPATAARILEAVTRAIRFFQAHRAWRDYSPCAAVGVLSDFAGPNQFLAEEVLLLLARRHLPFRVLLKEKQTPPEFTGLRAVIYPDQQEPSRPLRQELLAFVRAGGLLVAGPAWSARDGRPGPADVHGRYNVFLLGKGRLAIAREDLSDPYLLALDTHLLLSHRNDLLRLWNRGSLNAYYTEAPGGRTRLVQLVNYAARPAEHPVTLGLPVAYRSARFWELGAPAPQPLQPTPAPHGIELPLPPFPIHAAIELEG